MDSIMDAILLNLAQLIPHALNMRKLFATDRLR